MRRAIRARRHPRGTVAGEAGDAVDARGLNGFGEAHDRQEGGEAAVQPRLPRPGRSQEQIRSARLRPFLLLGYCRAWEWACGCLVTVEP